MSAESLRQSGRNQWHATVVPPVEDRAGWWLVVHESGHLGGKNNNDG